MMTIRKKAAACMAAALFIASQTLFSYPEAHAKEKNQFSDLLILQNVPQVTSKIKNMRIQLNAIHTYSDGHFTQTNSHLVWSSSNKNIASVNNSGLVKLTGHNGRSSIKVTDGNHSDRIIVSYKTPADKAASPSIAKIIKQKGSKYDVVNHAVKKMSLEEKIGQMLMPDFRTYNGNNVTEMLPQIRDQIRKYHLGGVILFRENLVNNKQIVKLTNDYQAASDKYGLLLTTDQEGGIVTRVQSGTDMPGNMALGAARSEKIAKQVGRATGEELSALGINIDMAPDLDVNNNPDNPVIGVRSFGEDPKLVARLGISFINGMHDSGVAATGKHFPGHGDTNVDSHLGLPSVPYDLNRLKKVELYPFKQAMDAGLDAVMTAHITFPKVDGTKVVSKKDGSLISLPATLSHKILTGLIREQMGFKGVIFTDAMNMQAITDNFGNVDAAIRAVNAGADILTMPVDLDSVYTGLIKAVKSGKIKEQRIDESVKRILTLKVKQGIIKSENTDDLNKKIDRANHIVGSPKHQKIAQNAANHAVTLIKNHNVLPLKNKNMKNSNITVIGHNYLKNLSDAVKRYHSNITTIDAASPLNDTQLNQVKKSSAIIIGTYTSDVDGRAQTNPQMQLVNQLIEKLNKPIIAVAIRNPYDIMAYPKVDAYLAQYSFNNANFNAAAATIFGKNDPKGQLPVTIPAPDGKGKALYPFGFGLHY
ncbi:beta-N-acetylhexosaminidase [Scopulibacillus daqui]|uniref:beta-N-acetylhexosaminidase n=1 Tax=Scopulibacillus daqui TaxID=1469162 RepID=A0ABS2Q000_9BACL|nr:glycoside hydrolase family 3 N-terminal domain-containing protein [Scopulibacillus daqui]MBM7645632.1 beta-N-acetylhexosaminidase [Scopulibacillus daqui]